MTRKINRGAKNTPWRNPLILEGINEIALYMGKSPGTIHNWIVKHGLPASKMPNGVWFTHKALILTWIMAGHRALLDQHAKYALEDENLQEMARTLLRVDPTTGENIPRQGVEDTHLAHERHFQQALDSSDGS